MNYKSCINIAHMQRNAYNDISVHLYVNTRQSNMHEMQIHIVGTLIYLSDGFLMVMMNFILGNTFLILCVRIPDVTSAPW